MGVYMCRDVFGPFCYPLGMKIYGIDFTSRPSQRKPLTCIECELSGTTLHADALHEWTSFEEFEATSPVLFGTKDSGAPNPAETLTTAMANEIADIAKNVYGYDPGQINNVSFPETQEQYTAKLDWYIKIGRAHV